MLFTTWMATFCLGVLLYTNMSTVFALMMCILFASLLAVVGLFYLVFNIILKRTHFRIKTELEQDSYSKLSSHQKVKYIASIVFCGVSLGILLFVLMPQ